MLSLVPDRRVKGGRARTRGERACLRQRVPVLLLPGLGLDDRRTLHMIMSSLLAHEEALRLDRDDVGSEHLLLGLLVEGKDVVTRALGSVDVDLERVRAAVHGSSGPHTRPSDRTKGGRTLDAIKVIVLAVDEAQRLGHQFADTEHVLLGVIRVAEDGGAGILGALGVNLEQARTALLRLLLD